MIPDCCCTEGFSVDVYRITQLNVFLYRSISRKSSFDELIVTCNVY